MKEPADNTLEAEDPTDVFLRLLGEHERAIRVYVLAMIPRVCDAEEILQDTRLAMWKSFGDFEVGTNFKAWGRKIAYHRILAFRAKKARESKRFVFSDAFYETLEEVAEENRELLEAEESEDERLLSFCLGKLRPEHRKVILSRYHDEKTVEEIAEAMNRTVGATYRVISRIRESLRRCVQEGASRPSAG